MDETSVECIEGDIMNAGIATQRQRIRDGLRFRLRAVHLDARRQLRRPGLDSGKLGVEARAVQFKTKTRVFSF
jgi:hypothetical protein